MGKQGSDQNHHPRMLALSATSLAFSAPALPPRTSPLSRAGVITAQNEMEPEEGWNVSAASYASLTHP